MPGAYAHITLVNVLKEPQRLEAVSNFPRPAISAVLDHFMFCELGAVSPDYPYLCLGDKMAARWADAMHYDHTGETLHAGIRTVAKLLGEDRRKALAWLLGYTAHVGADVTIHPVVELKVGDYATNQKAHRTCEMHQDAYIFQRLGLGDVGLSEHLDSGIGKCGYNGILDSTIAAAWNDMLRAVHPDEYKKNPPDANKWHRGFTKVVDAIEEGNQLMPMARHLAAGCGLTYPAVGDIDDQYILGLSTPNGKMSYDDIFDAAVRNVSALWSTVARGVLNGDKAHLTQITNWNLDTGRDNKGKLVLWG